MRANTFFYSCHSALFRYFLAGQTDNWKWSKDGAVARCLGIIGIPCLISMCFTVGDSNTFYHPSPHPFVLRKWQKTSYRTSTREKVTSILGGYFQQIAESDNDTGSQRRGNNSDRRNWSCSRQRTGLRDRTREKRHQRDDRTEIFVFTHIAADSLGNEDKSGRRYQDSRNLFSRWKRRGGGWQSSEGSLSGR